MLINSSENNPYDLIVKKAFEISYAICRISQSIQNDSFKKIFDEQGVKILNSATAKDIENTKQTIFSIEYFIHLAKSLNLLRNDLADTLVAELNNLNIFIAEYLKSLNNLDINTNDIFKTKLSIENNKKERNIKKIKTSINKNNENNNPAMDSAVNSAIEDNLEVDSAINNPAMILESDSAINLNNNSAIDSAIDSEKDSAMNSAIDSATDSAIDNSAIEYHKNLQDKENGFAHIGEIISQEKDQNFKKSNNKNDNSETIVRRSVFFDKIRYFDEFKLKDLEEIFPELSERTIRYYLSDLINKGLIERRGNSGPNVLYKVKKVENINVFEAVN